MAELFNTLFSSNQYIPHGHCYLWQTPLVWLHIVSDFLIAIAYFSIPIMLIYFVLKRSDVPFSRVFALFGAFITLCGVGHLLEIWTLWHPDYWLTGIEKAMTALVSCYTALSMVELLPRFLALRTPEQLEVINQELERLLVEQKATTTQQLMQSEKMSSLGQMVAGVAHEINNPVNFIYGNLSHAQDYLNDVLELVNTYELAMTQPSIAVQRKAMEIDFPFLREDLPKLLQSMQIGAERVRQIVLSLRNFSRLDESDTHPVEIHDCLDSTLLILNNRIKQGITVTRNYGKLPTIEGFSGPLYQVFMNILSNAIDALNEQSQSTKAITITTECLNTDYVSIRLADNGTGISLEHQAQLFEPFFTTKPIGVGTGLGLSISYQIVCEKHGGQLTCCSTPGEGTEFAIILPIKQQALVTAPLAMAMA
ncbi:MAG: HAMP domain-containing histidine kinase [Stenomitos rutilans HA7619-LM2]|jgi:signal transduction histidine kinase|nr:HAMP domain-containing histidine kinase [Stenomitos rutilans HA7619-LM2]